jgi:hypothetical protein
MNETARKPAKPANAGFFFFIRAVLLCWRKFPNPAIYALAKKASGIELLISKLFAKCNNIKNNCR